MIVDINKKKYRVNSNEFNTIIHNEYNNLNIKTGVGEMERVCSLLTELQFNRINNIILYKIVIISLAAFQILQFIRKAAKEIITI